jgi:integrase
MLKAARVHQDKRQVEKVGTEKASWYVTWREPDGKIRTQSCGAGSKGKMAADKKADKIHAELLTETYQTSKRSTWKDFREAYEQKILEPMEPQTREVVRQSLDVLERLVRLNKMTSITSETIAEFVSRRKAESGAPIRKGTTDKGKPIFEKTAISTATVNKDLRNIKACLRTAYEWGDIKTVPKITFLKEKSKLATYVSPEHFEAIYAACESAKYPSDIPNVTPGDWWKGLITLAMLTGWRIGQILDLKRADIDLNLGTAISQAESNKGGRDVKIPLHPIIVEHLRILSGSFDDYVFPWNKGRALIWIQFRAIQENAKLADGSPLPRGGKFGRWYGFHDLRRGFATMNAGKIDLFRLQTLMQHVSLETTKTYVNLAKSLNESVEALHVPQFLKDQSNKKVE